MNPELGFSSEIASTLRLKVKGKMFADSFKFSKNANKFLKTSFETLQPQYPTNLWCHPWPVFLQRLPPLLFCQSWWTNATRMFSNPCPTPITKVTTTRVVSSRKIPVWMFVTALRKIWLRNVQRNTSLKSNAPHASENKHRRNPPSFLLCFSILFFSFWFFF